VGDVQGLAYDPAAGVLYGSDVTYDQLVKIDPTTGWATPVGPLGFANVQGLAFDPIGGTLFGSDPAAEQLLSIDVATGAATAIGSPGSCKVRGLAFDPTTGTLYGSNTVDDTIETIDPLTGVATPLTLGNHGFKGVWGLTFDPVTSSLYGVNRNTGALVQFDTTTGNGVVVGYTVWKQLHGLAFDAAAGDIPSADMENARLLRVDPSTASPTAVGPFFFDDEGSVYLYELSFAPQVYCTAGTSASGCMASISAAGAPSGSAPSGFALSAASVEGGKNGFFYFGTSGRQAAPWGNGTSLQCVTPPVKRTALLPGSGTPGACNGAFSLDLNALWCPSCPSPAKNPGPGAVVQAQLWYRDPSNTSSVTTSLSDAIEFLVAP
jgi:DNA-binding beta-propeller fold protein YncE